jgi:hypothetical protein
MCQQKSNWFVVLFLLLALAGILTACGGQDQSQETPSEPQAETIPTILATGIK